MTSATLTYFLSDLHLGARYFPDPKAHERAVCDWLRSVAPTARRIYLVGDVLDYWFEYHDVVPRGHVRFFGTIAELADSGIEITWIIGNHDIWIFDYLPAELGIRVVDGVLEETIDGKRFVIAHGDGLGKVPPAERLMRWTFRNRILQRLFAAVHPRWTVGLAYAWSRKNRERRAPYDKQRPMSPAPVFEWVKERNASVASVPDYYIFGHFHTLDLRCVGNSQVAILGDWITNNSYAVFDGSTLTLRRR